jgi:hypothetical protein
VAAAWIGVPSFRITPAKVPGTTDGVIASAKLSGSNPVLSAGTRFAGRPLGRAAWGRAGVVG